MTEAARRGCLATRLEDPDGPEPFVDPDSRIGIHVVSAIFEKASRVNR